VILTESRKSEQLVELIKFGEILQCEVLPDF